VGLLDEVGARLTAAGVATTSAGSTGWRLVYRGLGPSPVRQVAVIPTGGFPAVGLDVRSPTFQLLLRGSSGDGATLEAKAEAAITALDQQSSAMSGWTWPDLRLQGGPHFLGWDEGQRPLYSLNFAALRSRTS
jgi:hypothetical protein